MAQEYQWKTDSTIISGGYPNEPHGVINGSTDWQTTTNLTGSTTAEYYFRDSASSSNSNSSRVVVSITESWTASISSTNYLTITLQTTIDSIRRDDIVGSPGTGGSPYRTMFARREAGGTNLWTTSGDDITTAHTILGSPLVLSEYSFTLAPGESASRGSIFFRSNVQGHDSDATPSIYVDEMWLGTHFLNPMPKDYIPGKIWNGSDWMSHNRATNGHAKIYTGSAWSADMKTVDGDGVTTGNPPYIYNGTNFANMRLIGTDA